MLVTSFDFFLSGVVLGLFCFVSYVVGVRRTDAKYITRAINRAEIAHRIAHRNDRNYGYVVTPAGYAANDETTVLPTVGGECRAICGVNASIRCIKNDGHNGVHQSFTGYTWARVEATEELQHRAHA